MLFILAQGLVFGSVLAEDQPILQDFADPSSASNDLANAPNELALSLTTGAWNHELSCSGGHFRETRYDRSRGLGTAQANCASDCEKDGNCAYAVFFYSSSSFTGSPYRCSFRTAECASTVEESHFTRSIYPRRTDEQNKAREEAARAAEMEECIRRTGQADCVPTSCEDIRPRSLCLEKAETLNCSWDSRIAKCSTVEVTTAPTTTAPTTQRPRSTPAIVDGGDAGDGLGQGSGGEPTAEPTSEPMIDDCFEHDIDYHGNDIPGYVETDTAHLCQEECLRKAGCDFWTWHPAGACYLKTSKAGREVESPFVSGPKFCGQPEVTTTAAPPSMPSTFEKNELALTLSTGAWNSRLSCSGGHFRETRYDRSRGLGTAQANCASDCEKDGNCAYAVFFYSSGSFTGSPYRCSFRTAECAETVEESHFTRSIYPRRTNEQNKALEDAARQAEIDECIKRTGQPDCVPISCEDIWSRSVCLEYAEALNCSYNGRFGTCSTVE